MTVNRRKRSQTMNYFGSEGEESFPWGKESHRGNLWPSLAMTVNLIMNLLKERVVEATGE